MNRWTDSGGLACSQLRSLASPLLRCVLITEARPPTRRRSPSIDFRVPSRRIDKQLQSRERKRRNLRRPPANAFGILAAAARSRHRLGRLGERRRTEEIVPLSLCSHGEAAKESPSLGTDSFVPSLSSIQLLFLTPAASKQPPMCAANQSSPGCLLPRGGFTSRLFALIRSFLSFCVYVCVCVFVFSFFFFAVDRSN